MSTLRVNQITSYDTPNVSIDSDINVVGTITATTYYGDGSHLSGLSDINLLIPVPQIFINKINSDNIPTQHFRNESITAVTQYVSGYTWNQSGINLYFNTNNLEFLNYNPKYFLYVYKEKIRGSHKGIYIYPRKTKDFVHPPNGNNYGSTNNTYTNYGGTIYFDQYSPNFSAFTTEWSVENNIFKGTSLIGFDPLRFYKVWNYGTSTWDKGTPFFPLIYYSSITNNDKYVNVYGTKAVSSTKTNTKLTLYLKFAIVIQDPNNSSRYVVGPFSETIKIFPKKGYFNNGINNDVPYYYSWSLSRVK